MHTPTSNRVLVVDDEPTIRELIGEALRESGYDVDTAAHGAEALDRMHRARPDAVVLDLMMPRLDGTSFVELMRLNPCFASVPIVLVTATYGAAQVAERIGARACITKPFELDELVEVVRGIVSEPLRAPLDALGEVPSSSVSEVWSGAQPTAESSAYLPDASERDDASSA
jgi:CheY-like chemotaxis protein